MNYTTGNLIKARERLWTVLPGSDNELLIVRPVGGSDHEETGIYTSLEKVESGNIDLPDPSSIGDYISSSLLRNAVRLSTRASAGPFRSFGRIAVEPRPYQLVPLLMALKMNPVRICISDDVGIGKTVEAGLIARELLDRGEIERICVLCPPHLAEQWQTELSDKFNIEAELILAGNASALERKYRIGLSESIFNVVPFTIVSMDFIKSERRRDDFILNCPELVIIDEAHSCAYGYEGKGKHRRFDLVKRISQNNDRHLVLVTATPHSGKEETFKSLIGLLKPEFSDFPDDLSAEDKKLFREKLSDHFIQRRRADIKHYMQENTPFPERDDIIPEETYTLHEDYKKFFNKILKYCRGIVTETESSKQRQRVKWWSALALLRAVGSSPAAAVQTLKNRSAVIDAETIEEAEDIGRKTVLDASVDDDIGMDTAPGSATEEDLKENIRADFAKFIKDAEDLKGKKDNKLMRLITILERFLSDGYNPIVFCRFIPTAEYIAESIRDHFKSKILPAFSRQAKEKAA